MNAITAPGVFDLTEEAYHADPCPVPSLSASIAAVLLDRTPWHAWTAHPRLNPDFEPNDRDTFDLGRAAHALMLAGEGSFAVVDAADWRTAAAKQARDEARAAGKTPILAHRMAEVRRMVFAGRRQIEFLSDADDRLAFKPGTGTPERTLVWREGKTWCRARLDWHPAAGAVFHDYKTTGASAHPDAWARTAYGMGADVQAGLYRRAIRAALGIDDPEFRFVVQENTPPFALCVVALTPAAMDLAERKALAAIDLWSRCTAAGRWPGYPARTCYIDPPGYEETRWLEREERATQAKRENVDLLKLAIDAQAPLERTAP